jgi:hypothetical protein
LPDIPGDEGGERHAFEKVEVPRSASPWHN